MGYFPRLSFSLLSLVAFALLSGCAAPTSTRQPSIQPELKPPDNWQMEGKIGFATPTEKGSANIRWQQQGDTFSINLFGPLGQGATQIIGDKTLVVLTQGGKEYRASTAEQLMLDTLGWSLPLSDFQFWITGQAAPGTPPKSLSRDEQGLPNLLQQSGWQINYLSHQPVIDYWLPQKLLATADDVTMTLIIKRWTLPTTTNNP